MVREMSPVLPVDELTGLLHILGHARGTAAKYSNLSNLLQEEEPKVNKFTGRAGSVLKKPQGSCRLALWSYERPTGFPLRFYFVRCTVRTSSL